MALNPGQIASIVEGGVGITAALGGAIYGAIKSGRLNREADAIRTRMKNENKEWYNVKMAQDYTQRADVQAAIKKQRELLDEQYKRARATNIVAGGTDEALALQKQAANQSLSQTATDIAARGADYKDNVERQYRAQDYALNQQELQNKQQQAAATAQAASQVVNAGLSMTGNSFQHFAQASGAGGMGSGGVDPSQFQGGGS